MVALAAFGAEQAIEPKERIVLFDGKSFDGGTVRLTVNGLLQNKGSGADPSWGPICLQSEGSPSEFRNVYLEPLDR